jgi:hypothetical protein
MNGVILRYKKPEWTSWVTWPCRDREEANRIREELEARGYQVEG